MKSPMTPRSERLACNCGRQASWMGDQNFVSRAPPCSGRHVKPLVKTAFAVVISQAAGHNSKLPHLHHNNGEITPLRN
jgi:hypothetical protein